MCLFGREQERLSVGAPVNARSVVCGSANTDEIVEKMKSLTLLEASELVSQIEETFGVDASAPAGGMVMAQPQAGGGAEEEAEEVQTNFDVVITDVDDSQRIGAIKVLRGLTDLGLKEAKDAMSNLPYTVLEGKPKETADDAKSQLEEAGCACSCHCHLRYLAVGNTRLQFFILLHAFNCSVQGYC